ncbi:MAG: UDP-2,3-diacylglucosamine diphosphatase [Gemmatimonadota bacterium]
MTKPHTIVSDIHLGAVPDTTERAFVRFLEHVGDASAALLIAGDLFDFWFEYGEVVPGRHFRTLAALARLVDAGMPVRMAGGNHDAWGGRFLREHVGITFDDAPFIMELGGRRALVAHGDGLGRGDLRYKALKAVLRSRAATGAFRALHPEIGLRIARLVSSTEARAGIDAAAAGRAAFLDAWAADQLRLDPSLDCVVCGHSHVPVIREVEPDRFYLNAGDWISHFSYITMTDGVPTLQTWSR